MVSIFPIKRNDTSPSIQVILLDSGDNPIDLTGSTVKFHMKVSFGAEPKISSEAEIVSPTEGLVQYNWKTGDTDTTGTFLAEWEVTFPNGDIQTFPNDGYIYIKITKDLD